MCAKVKQKEAQNPLILRCHRLMEAFAKSDDERDFFIDRQEGFIIYLDLDKSNAEITALEKELRTNFDRYCLIPKLSYYETKKIMEGFVNEKVYDIDTKEKLLEIIQSKEAKENFLEFIFDHHSEWEKWQQYYQERSRVRMIEWLRLNNFHFVFEEDIELPRSNIEKLKENLFNPKADKELASARKLLVEKAKTYYSNEALNPRPKRGRPPKQIAKLEIEPQVTVDLFLTVPPPAMPFLFTPEPSSISSSNSIFSSKFEIPDAVVRSSESDASIEQKLAALRTLSSRWSEAEMSEPVQKDKVSPLEANTKKVAVKPASTAKSSPAPIKKGAKPVVKPKPKSAAKPALTKKAAKPKRIIPVAKKVTAPPKKKRLKKIMPRRK